MVIVSTFDEDSQWQGEAFNISYIPPVEAYPSKLSWRLLRIASNLSIKRIITWFRRRRFGHYGEHLLYQTICERHPDVIYAVNADVLTPCAHAAEKMGAYLVYDAYEFWPDYRDDPICKLTRAQRKFLAEAELTLLPETDMTITVSDYLAREYKQTYNLENDVKVFYNVPQSPRSKISEIHNPVRVVFSGNLQPDRNLLPLFEAVADLEKVELTFFGGGDMLDTIRALIVQRGVSEKIFAPGPVPIEDLLGTLSEYDIGAIVHKPYNRNFDGALPNKFFEYMFAGLAIIATDTESMRSFPAFNSFGILLQKPDADSITQALRYLISQPELIRSYKNSALIEAGNYRGDRQGERLIRSFEAMFAHAPKSATQSER
jgi:glycosyltransferase involved in cell wall biosynthesis